MPPAPKPPTGNPVVATGDQTDHTGIGGLYFATDKQESAALGLVTALLIPPLYDLFVWQLQETGAERLVVGSLKAPIAVQTFDTAKQILHQQLPPKEGASLRDIRWITPDVGDSRDEIREVRDKIRESVRPTNDDADWFWPMDERLAIAEYGTAPTEIKVAHIDTGITVHPCLAQGYESGKSFVDEGAPGLIRWKEPRLPFIDHGTATASLMIGATHGSLVMKGMALPQNAERRLPITVVPCRVGDSPILTPIEVKRVARAISWAVDYGCKVISISMGAPLSNDDLLSAVKNAHNNGVIVCAAAGQIFPILVWPAAFATKGYLFQEYGNLCICCGPSTRERKPWPGAMWIAWKMSQLWSEYVTISAPGTEMPKATWDGDPDTGNAILTTSEGSSYSTAYVASVAALWYCKNFQLLERVPAHKRVGLFRELLVMTCDPWPASAQSNLLSFGPGLVNATRLLRTPLELMLGEQLVAVTAAAHSGGIMQLWGINSQGALATASEQKSGWTVGEFVANGPRDLIALTAANQGDDRCAFWAVDKQGALHCTYQPSAGGGWQPWIGPTKANPRGWEGPPQLKTVCAVLEGGGRGVRLWGIDVDGSIHYISQQSPGGGWGAWSRFEDPEPFYAAVALAAVRYADGRSVLWVANERRELFCRSETAIGSWSKWIRNWNTPPPHDGRTFDAPGFSAICAASHSGGVGQFWGVDHKGVLLSSYQRVPNGDWTNWAPFTADSPRDVVAMTAARRKDDRCTLWAIDKNRTLFVAHQRSDGDWFPWNKWTVGM